MTTAFPLSWPDHIPRARTRERGKFSTSLTAALGNVQTSLRLFGKDSGGTHEAMTALNKAKADALRAIGAH